MTARPFFVEYGLLEGLEFTAPLPDAADLVVIGGGVIGVTTALYAARAGMSVLLLEKGRVAAEQSARNWGWIRVQGRDMAEVPIALEAQALWPALDAECGGRLGVKTVGVSYLARNDKTMADYADWLKDARELGVSSRLLDAAGVRDTHRGAAAPWAGALHTPTDMRAEPWGAVPELARLASRDGVMIREGCAVRALDIEAGRVTGVVTEAGRVKAGAVVLAGGAWSALFLRNHGVALPQLSVRSNVATTAPVAGDLQGAGVDDRLAFRRRADGGFTLAPAAYSELYVGPDAFRALRAYLPLALEGSFDVRLRPLAPKGFPDAWGTARRWGEGQSPFERMRVLSPAPDAKRLARLRSDFMQAFPTLGPVQLSQKWAGMIDVLPDVVPVVDHIAPLPGLIAVTGMCGHGFGIGPAFGRIAAALAREDAPGHELTRFRFGRFTEKASLIPGPNI